MLQFIGLLFLILQIFDVAFKANAQVVSRILQSSPDLRGDASRVGVSIIESRELGVEFIAETARQGVGYRRDCI
jgi:hypothetical protein